MPLPENQQIEARITSGRGAHLSKGKTEAVVRRREVFGEWDSRGAESDEGVSMPIRDDASMRDGIRAAASSA
jgi:hypothetical protein